jgi:hypothetical protein
LRKFKEALRLRSGYEKGSPSTTLRVRRRKPFDYAQGTKKEEGRRKKEEGRKPFDFAQGTKKEATMPYALCPMPKSILSDKG